MRTPLLFYLSCHPWPSPITISFCPFLVLSSLYRVWSISRIYGQIWSCDHIAILSQEQTRKSAQKVRKAEQKQQVDLWNMDLVQYGRNTWNIYVSILCQNVFFYHFIKLSKNLRQSLISSAAREKSKENFSFRLTKLFPQLHPIWMTIRFGVWTVHLMVMTPGYREVNLTDLSNVNCQLGATLLCRCF